MNIPVIDFPLPENISKEQISLTKEANDMLSAFLSLERDLSTSEIGSKLSIILEEYYKSGIHKHKKKAAVQFVNLQKEHEQYYNIIRYENMTGDLMVENVIQSYHKFLDDYQQGSNLTPIDLGHIDAALKSLCQYLQ